VAPVVAVVTALFCIACCASAVAIYVAIFAHMVSRAACSHKNVSKHPADKRRRCDRCGTYLLWDWEVPLG
jgi:hypothetical protein